MILFPLERHIDDTHQNKDARNTKDQKQKEVGGFFNNPFVSLAGPVSGHFAILHYIISQRLTSEVISGASTKSYSSFIPGAGGISKGADESFFIRRNKEHSSQYPCIHECLMGVSKVDFCITRGLLFLPHCC